MSKVIRAEVLLGKIEQAQREYALESNKVKPAGAHDAYVHHGVYIGMENAKNIILDILKDNEEKNSTDYNFSGTGRSGPHAYR